MIANSSGTAIWNLRAASITPKAERAYQLADAFRQFEQDEVLVFGGIGEGMINGLNAIGLQVVTGASGRVVDVAKAYAMGTLVSTGSVCQDHEHHGH